MRTKRRVVAAKVEGVEGTAEALTAAEGGVLAIDPKVDVDMDRYERNAAKASIGKLASLVGSRKASLSFKAEVAGAGAAYSASVLPKIDTYLMACGFARTLVTTGGSESVTYAPASTGDSSITLGCYEDGVIKSIKGARGDSCKIVSKVGEPVIMEFVFTGVWNGLLDGAMLAPTYGPVPPVFLSAGFTVDSYAAVISAINIDIANTTHLRDSANAAEGYLSNVITERKITGDMDPEMVLKATRDWYGKWLAGAAGALNIGYIGSTQYNKFKITGPALVPTKVSDDDAEGQVIAGHTFEMAETTGDNEISILFD